MPDINFLKPGTPEADGFPAVGHTYEADLGGDIFVQFEYHSVNSMTIYGLKSEHKGFTQTVEISVMPVRPGVFTTGCCLEFLLYKQRTFFISYAGTNI